MKQMFKSTSKVPNEATLSKSNSVGIQENQNVIATHWSMERIVNKIDTILNKTGKNNSRCLIEIDK